MQNFNDIADQLVRVLETDQKEHLESARNLNAPDATPEEKIEWVRMHYILHCAAILALAALRTVRKENAIYDIGSLQRSTNEYMKVRPVEKMADIINSTVPRPPEHNTPNAPLRIVQQARLMLEARLATLQQQNNINRSINENRRTEAREKFCAACANAIVRHLHDTFNDLVVPEGMVKPDIHDFMLHWIDAEGVSPETERIWHEVQSRLNTTDTAPLFRIIRGLREFLQKDKEICRHEETAMHLVEEKEDVVPPENDRNDYEEEEDAFMGDHE